MNRRQQNAAHKAWQDLKRLINDLDPLVTPVLLRGEHDSGLHRGRPEPNRPTHSDPTGETAVLESFEDGVHKDIVKMAEYIQHARNIAENVMAMTPSSVAERARVTIPDCQACGQPCLPRVVAGYCRSCYERKRYLKIADRAEFERVRRSELSNIPTEQ